MTAEEWKKAENDLLTFGYPIKLKVDEYEISLVLTRENMKMYIVLFVNGEFKWQWIHEDCDIRKRFMCPSKHCLVKQKDLDRVTKSKKKQQKIKTNNTYTSYSPYWTSFKRLKSHLIKNNTSIEFKERA